MCHNQHKNWSGKCHIIESLLNETTSSATGKTPHLLMMGKPPPPLFSNIPASIPVPSQVEVDHLADALTQIKIQRERRKQRAHRTKHAWSPKVDDLVLIKYSSLSDKARGISQKLNLVYKGPFRITKVFGANTFQLADLKSGKAYCRANKILLKKYETPEV